jgi:DNA-binding LacI/PurR family transcriptional regulator
VTEERAGTRQRTPTIRDVARHAGVSVATVSRVLNEVPVVRTEVRDRVRRSIGELGYRPSSTARSLSLGRSQALGVVAPFLTSPSVVERLRGVVQRVSERGYDLMLFGVETPEQRLDAFGRLAGLAHVDGLLVISLPMHDDELDAVRRGELPVVTLDVAHPGIPHVAIDDVRGGELATEHLLAKGHRRIGFVGDLPSSPFGFTSSERRRAGYRAALSRAGLRPDAALERFGPHDRDAARALGESLLAGPDRPSAVFAASDTQAAGVLEAARALGLGVPDDVAVMGFDDIEVAALLGLTTVRQPLRQSGARATDLLLAALERRPVPDDALDPLAVIERRTT